LKLLVDGQGATIKAAAAMINGQLYKVKAGAGMVGDVLHRVLGFISYLPDVFVGDNNGSLHSYRADPLMSLNWRVVRHSSGSIPDISTAPGDFAVHTMGYNYRTHLFRKTDGFSIWYYQNSYSEDGTWVRGVSVAFGPECIFLMDSIGRILKLNKDTGQVVWRKTAAQLGFHSVIYMRQVTACSNGDVLICEDGMDGRLMRLNSSGGIVWTYGGAGNTAFKQAENDQNGIIFTCADWNHYGTDFSLRAFTPEGNLIWEDRGWHMEDIRRIVVTKKSLYCVMANRLQKRSKLDGALIWERNDYTLDANHIFNISASPKYIFAKSWSPTDRLYKIDPENGDLLDEVIIDYDDSYPAVPVVEAEPGKLGAFHSVW